MRFPSLYTFTQCTVRRRWSDCRNSTSWGIESPGQMSFQTSEENRKPLLGRTSPYWRVPLSQTEIFTRNTTIESSVLAETRLNNLPRLQTEGDSVGEKRHRGKGLFIKIYTSSRSETRVNRITIRSKVSTNLLTVLWVPSSGTRSPDPWCLNPFTYKTTATRGSITRLP